MLPAPPAIAATESTKRILLLLGTLPSLSIRPPSVAIAVTVPTVSKKSESKSVKTRRIAAMMVTPSTWNPPSRSKSPKRLKSGFATISEGIDGTFSPHPFGLTLPVAPSKLGPILKAFSTMIARTVAAMMLIRIAPLTFFTKSAIIKIRPKPKMIIGHPTRVPLSPSVTGTGPAPVRRTNPASTRPINVMKSPIPTEIAILSC
ncbi:unannotated protein [freshwater metagenome]|uniref:Unannotated protein n=1 Tax=freshwater metagenome TaxID=449393 RepID=A0A6J7G289_9ZZZZ